MKANATRGNTGRAALLFGRFADDPLAREIMSYVATWPKSKSKLTDRLGNFAKVVKAEAQRGNGVREQMVEARVHPALDWLLEIIVPALCSKDAKPFRLLADAIEAVRGNEFPDNELAFNTWQIACEMSGHVMPFAATGEPLAPETLTVELPAIIRVPVTESELRRKVKARLGWGGKEEDDLNPGTFTRLIHRLQIRCRKDRHSGGRGRKVLHKRNSKQKPN